MKSISNAPIVIAYCDKEEKTKRVFSFRLGVVVFDWIKHFLLDSFTRKEITQKVNYTRIYSIDANMMRKLDKLPESIVLLITQYEK